MTGEGSLKTGLSSPQPDKALAPNCLDVYRHLRIDISLSVLHSQVMRWISVNLSRSCTLQVTPSSWLKYQPALSAQIITNQRALIHKEVAERQAPKAAIG